MDNKNKHLCIVMILVCIFVKLFQGDTNKDCRKISQLCYYFPTGLMRI